MPHLSGIIGDKTWVHSIREYSKWLPLLFLLNSSLLSGKWSMSIWINKKRKNNIYSTGKHWVNNACVSAPTCREREMRVDGGWYVHSFKNLWSSIFDCTPLVISTMLRTSLSMPEKGNTFISKQKHSFSQGAFVCEHDDLSEHFEVVCTQKDGLRRVTFSPENMGQLISYYHIFAKLEHIYPEMQQNNSKKDNGSKKLEWDDASRGNAG